MKRKQLRITGILLTICMILGTIFPVLAETENTSLEISAASGILMEVETGKILYEKDSNTRRSPASVTKVMTLLLIFPGMMPVLQWQNILQGVSRALWTE